MGEVYLAEDTRLGRQVALKFLPASYQYDPDRRTRFMAEARATSALRSPHIVSIYDIGEHEGTIFIVMEYVEGESLSQRLERGPLVLRDVIGVAVQIADALAEAHQIGIIHCDIKSANLIVNERGGVKVLDFGIAKVAENTSSGQRRPDEEAGQSDRHQRSRGDCRLYVAGAGHGPSSGSSFGHLFAWSRDLRNADRAIAFRGRFRHRSDGQNHSRGADGHRATQLQRAA